MPKECPTSKELIDDFNGIIDAERLKQKSVLECEWKYNQARLALDCMNSEWCSNSLKQVAIDHLIKFFKEGDEP